MTKRLQSLASSLSANKFLDASSVFPHEFNCQTFDQGWEGRDQVAPGASYPTEFFFYTYPQGLYGRSAFDGTLTSELNFLGSIGFPNRPFPSSPGPLFRNEGRCSTFDIEIIFYSLANKTHFHKKGCAPSLILKVRVFGTRKWPIFFRSQVSLRTLGRSAIHSRPQCLRF